MTWNANDIDRIDDLLYKSRKQGDPINEEILETPEQREAYHFVSNLQEASRRNELNSKLALLKSLDLDMPEISGDGANPEQIEQADSRKPSHLRKKSRVVQIRSRQIISAAAILLIAVLAVWWLMPRSEFALPNDSTLALKYDEYVIHPGADHDSQEQLELEQIRDRAYHLYETRQCRSAIPELNYVLEHETDEEYRSITLFYLVVCYYAIDQQSRALELYNSNLEDFTQVQREKLENLIK